MLTSTFTIGIVASVAWVVSACGVEACDTGILPSIVVEVRDSITGAAAAAGADARAIDGNYTVPFDVHEVDPEGRPLSLAMPGERAGTYIVRVTKPEYLPWEQRNVQVEDSGCHTEQIRLTAKLQPAT